MDKWTKQAETTGSFKEADNRTDAEKELIELRKRNKQLEILAFFYVKTEVKKTLGNMSDSVAPQLLEDIKSRCDKVIRELDSYSFE